MAAWPPTTYTISDLAREFDLTTRAIRFYEDMGLLQPERSGPGGRNRVYSARDRTRLKLTLRAKRLGLSLTEAQASIIDMYDSPRDTGPQLQQVPDRAGAAPQAARGADGRPAGQPRRGEGAREARPAPCWREPEKARPAGIIDVYVNVNSPGAAMAAPVSSPQDPDFAARVRASFARQARDADHRRRRWRRSSPAAW